jgi:hypothetical protein
VQSLLALQAPRDPRRGRGLSISAYASSCILPLFFSACLW